MPPLAFWNPDTQFSWVKVRGPNGCPKLTIEYSTSPIVDLSIFLFPVSLFIYLSLSPPQTILVVYPNLPAFLHLFLGLFLLLLLPLPLHFLHLSISSIDDGTKKLIVVDPKWKDRNILDQILSLVKYQDPNRIKSKLSSPPLYESETFVKPKRAQQGEQMLKQYCKDGGKIVTLDPADTSADIQAAKKTAQLLPVHTSRM